MTSIGETIDIMSYEQRLYLMDQRLKSVPLSRKDDQWTVDFTLLNSMVAKVQRNKPLTKNDMHCINTMWTFYSVYD